MIHQRLGHISADSIRDLIHAYAATGLHPIDLHSLISYDSYEHAKATRKIIRKQTINRHAQAFGDEVHTDVWGPALVTTIRKRRYYITFTDDYSRLPLNPYSW